MLALVIKRYLRRTSQLVLVSVLASSFVALAVAVTSTSSTIQEATVAQALHDSSFAESGISITYDGDFSIVPQERIAQEVSKVESRLDVEPFVQFVTYRPMVNSIGQTFHIVGIDSSHVRMTAGEIPRSCTATSCQVALLSGDAVAMPPGFVNTGALTIDTTAVKDLTLLSGIPVLVTADVQGLMTQSVIKDMPRTVVWATHARPSAFVANGSEQTLVDMRAQANEMLLLSGRLVLHFPDVFVQAAIDQSQSAINRLLRLEMVVGILLLIAIAALAENARHSHSEAMRVVEQIRGARPRAMPWVSSLVAHAVPLLLSLAALALTDVSPIEVGLFMVMSIVTTGISLNFGAKPIAALFALVIAVIIVLQREPGLVSVAVTLLMAIGARQLLRRSWKEPIALSTARSSQLLVNSGLLGISAAIVSGWVVTASALDKQELHHIDFVSPLTTTITGVESGVLQNKSLADYRSLGEVVTLEKISATTSAKALTVQNIQVIGLPSAPMIPSQEEIGGPTSKQLQAIHRDVPEPFIHGLNKALSVRSLPSHIQLGVWMLDENNQSMRVPLTTVLSTTDRVIGVEAYESAKDIERREHAVGEGKHAVDLPHGRLTFELPNGRLIDKDVRLTSGSLFFPVNRESETLDAIVNSDLAKIGDTIIVNITPEQSVKINVVDVVKRFPTAAHNFALIDQAVLNNYLASSSPALIRTSEIWMNGNVPSKDKGFAGLKIIRRDELTQSFLVDPVRNGIRKLYFTTAALLVIAMAALTWMTMNRELRSANLREWIGRGNNLAALKRSIMRVVNVSMMVSGALGIVVGYFATARLLAIESQTWAGLPAIPPVESSLSIVVQSGLLVLIRVSVLLGAVIGRSRYVD